MDVNEIEHEQLIITQNHDLNYKSVIAVHSTRLGPAVGGTRFKPYDRLDEAVQDALLLARAMTLKNAIHRLPFGGGKAVVMAPSELEDRELFFRYHGAVIDNLSGAYVTAEDVGTTPADMQFVAAETAHVAHGVAEGLGPYTARGVFRSMEAAALHAWGSPNLSGRHVLVFGCGNVGAALAKLLVGAGAHVHVTDTDKGRASETAARTGGDVVPIHRWRELTVDILAPCALGGILTTEVASTTPVRLIAGAANNQLASEAVAEILAERKITYVPDFVANGGGVIKVAEQLCGRSPVTTDRHIDTIFETTTEVLSRAREGGITALAAAMDLASARFNQGNKHASPV